MTLDTRPNLNDDKFEQYSDDQLSLSGTTDIYGIFNSKSGSTVNIQSGSTFTLQENAGTGKVLISNNSGQGTWQEISIPSSERIIKEITQTSHGFSVGDFIGWSGGTYNKAIADGTYDGEYIGLVNNVYDTDKFDVTQAGYVSGLTSLTANTTYFLSTTNAGELVDSKPTDEGHISKAVLIADSEESGWVLPYPGFIISSGSTGGEPAGDNYEIQYNSGGDFGASSRLKYDSTKNSFTAGYRCGDIGDNSVVLGGRSTSPNEASGNVSIAFGQDTIASGLRSVAGGDTTIASGFTSIAFGQETIAGGNNSVAFGYNTKANGGFSVVFGNNTTANSVSSIAFGDKTVANGDISFAAGCNVTASDYLEIALGQNNVINNGDSGTWVETDNLFTIGNGTGGTRNNAFQILKNGDTTIDGDLTVNGNISGVTFSGISSGGEPAGDNYEVQFNSGDTFTASSQFAYDPTNNIFTAGYRCGDIGDNSFVGNGDSSNLNEASGNFSTAFGKRTTANDYLETVLGQCNEIGTGDQSSWVETDNLFTIGNGTGSTRNNAFQILKNGDTTIDGDLTVNGDIIGYSSDNYYLCDASFDTGNGELTLCVNGASNQVVDLDGRYCTSDTNYYVDGVSGSGNGTLTISVNGASNQSTDLSHTHDDRYYTESQSNSKYVRKDTYQNNSFQGDYLIWNDGGTSNRDFIAYNDSNDAFLFNADTSLTNTSANATVCVHTLCATSRSCSSVHCSTYAFRISGSGLRYCGSNGACGCATDWIATSDICYKKNIEPITSALSKVNSLCGVCYNLCSNNSADMGLIAQDVEKIEPRLVTKNEPSDEDREKYNIKDEVYGLKYDKFAGLFVEAIKELKKENEQLKNEINNIKQKIE